MKSCLRCVWCWRVTVCRRQAQNSFVPSSSGSFSTLLMPWASCQLLEKNPRVTDLQLHCHRVSPCWGSESLWSWKHCEENWSAGSSPNVNSTPPLWENWSGFQGCCGHSALTALAVQRQSSASHETCPSLQGHSSPSAPQSSSLVFLETPKGGRKTHCTEWELQGEQNPHPSLPCCQSNRFHTIPLIPVTC